MSHPEFCCWKNYAVRTFENSYSLRLPRYTELPNARRFWKITVQRLSIHTVKPSSCLSGFSHIMHTPTAGLWAFCAILMRAAHGRRGEKDTIPRLISFPCYCALLREKSKDLRFTVTIILRPMAHVCETTFTYSTLQTRIFSWPKRWLIREYPYTTLEPGRVIL